MYLPSIKYLDEDGPRGRNMQEVYQMLAYHCIKSQCSFWYIKMVTCSVNSHNITNKSTSVTIVFLHKICCNFDVFRCILHIFGELLNINKAAIKYRWIINHLKPKTYFMYHQFQHSEIVCSAHNAFMCFAWISEQTAIAGISLYSIYLSFFLTEAECLLRGTNWFFKDSYTFVLKGYIH